MHWLISCLSRVGFLKLFLELIFLVLRPRDQVDVQCLKIEKYFLETNEMISHEFKKKFWLNHMSPTILLFVTKTL